MADLSTILKDPAFVNANPATQQAIFDKWAPQDPNFANANVETQSAIRQKFGIPVMTPTGGPRMTGSLADQIPGSGVQAPASTAAPARPESGFFGKLMAPVETAVTLGTSAITAPIVEGAKIYGALTSGKFGTQAGIKAGEQTGRKVQQFFQPQVSPESERQTAAISNFLAQTGLQGVPLNVLADLQRGAMPAVRAATDVGGAKVAQRVERIAQEASDKDYQRAAQIEAAQAAKRLGNVALNPADSNPNVKTKLLVNAAGDAVVNAKAAKSNASRWNEIAREDMGLPKNTPLDDKAWDKALAMHDAPYQVVEKIPVMQASDDLLAQINSLKLDPRSTNNPDKVARINASVDRTLDQVSEGLSGKNVVSQIRDFRKDANQTFKNPNATGIEIDVAEAQISIANALENLIEFNIKDPTALDALRAARTGKAKVYDWERATGITTKQVDPAQIVKMAEKGKPLTGKLADVANVAGNFPDIATLKSANDPLLYQRLRRGGVGGTAGFILGGGPGGAAVGAGLTSLGSEGTANLLTRPSIQNRLAIPQDRRIPLREEPTIPSSQNAMIPVAPEVFGAGGQPAARLRIIDYDVNGNPIYAPARGERAPGTPDFTMQSEPTFGNRPTVFESQRGLPNEVPRQVYEAQTRAELAQEFRAKDERQPARGGTAFELDPVTGKLVPVDTTLRGATPDIQIIESTGKSLSGAANILSSGKSPALMSAEQKIAWEKTKVDLADVVPGMKALSDKAIASKMQDRAWVQDAIAKAQDKAKAFADIAAKADNERLRQDALMKREQMVDLLETLEEQFRKARPVKTGGQGPKTRAFQRNMLRPDDGENQNALVK
jgi:hypothetical protein